MFKLKFFKSWLVGGEGRIRLVGRGGGGISYSFALFYVTKIIFLLHDLERAKWQG